VICVQKDSEDMSLVFSVRRRDRTPTRHGRKFRQDTRDVPELEALVGSCRRRESAICCDRLTVTSQVTIGCDHRHIIIDKYLDTLQTARTALPPTVAKSGNRKMADCQSYY